jgi:hypothetical protein
MERLEADVARMQDAMREASRIVFGGFALTTDATVVRHPDRYMDERGTVMWQRVMALLERAESAGAVNLTAGCCCRNNTPSPTPFTGSCRKDGGKSKVA